LFAATPRCFWPQLVKGVVLTAALLHGAKRTQAMESDNVPTLWKTQAAMLALPKIVSRRIIKALMLPDAHRNIR
jgi:hypothetical protein